MGALDNAATASLALGQPEIAGAIEIVNYADDIGSAVGSAMGALNGVLGGNGPIDFDGVANSALSEKFGDLFARNLDDGPLVVFIDSMAHGTNGFIHSPHTVDWTFNKLGYDPAKKQRVGDLYNRVLAGENSMTLAMGLKPAKVPNMANIASHISNLKRVSVPQLSATLNAAIAKGKAIAPAPKKPLNGQALKAFHATFGLPSGNPDLNAALMAQIAGQPGGAEGASLALDQRSSLWWKVKHFLHLV